MTTSSIQTVASDIADSPLQTALFLGAGVSVQSGGPTGAELSTYLLERFFPEDKPRTLVDACTRIEAVYGRPALVSTVRESLGHTRPEGSLLQLPEFRFSRVFTTNFDELVEQCYVAKGIELPRVRSNSDLTQDLSGYATVLFKVHGCVSEDYVDGAPQGMILTEDDYRTSERYRQICINFLENSLLTSNVIFVGYSLADDNIRSYVERAIELRRTQNCPGRVFLVQYEEDEVAASIWSRRGVTVAFGGLDELLSSMILIKKSVRPTNLVNPLSSRPRHEVSNAISCRDIEADRAGQPRIERMASGAPASYSDIASGFAFRRRVVDTIVTRHRISPGPAIHILSGPSGCGKTTAARVTLSRLSQELGFKAFEHKQHLPIDISAWQQLDSDLHASNTQGVLMLDEMTNYQLAINTLSRYLVRSGKALTLLVCAHPAIWKVRTKSPELSRFSNIHDLSVLHESELSGIIDLAFGNPAVRSLLSPEARSLSREEAYAQIRSNTRRDLFVCLKYLFDKRSLDEIILREFSVIDKQTRPPGGESVPATLYKLVSFLEAAGRNVHRQMVLRLTEGLDYSDIASALDGLSGIIFEEERDEVEGIYLWRTRHPRIAEIVSASKFSVSDRKNLLERSIDILNPAVTCERLYGNMLCNSPFGVDALDRDDQTRLYERLSEVMPFERVPRHRYIRNLLRSGELSQAEIEVERARSERIDDSVIDRYEVDILIEKSRTLTFLEVVDRTNILELAHERALRAVERRHLDMYNYNTLCKVALEHAKLTASTEMLEAAIDKLKEGYSVVKDSHMEDWIGRYTSELVRVQRPMR